MSLFENLSVQTPPSEGKKDSRADLWRVAKFTADNCLFHGPDMEWSAVLEQGHKREDQQIVIVVEDAVRNHSNELKPRESVERDWVGYLAEGRI